VERLYGRLPSLQDSEGIFLILHTMSLSTPVGSSAPPLVFTSQTLIVVGEETDIPPSATATRLSPLCKVSVISFEDEMLAPEIECRVVSDTCPVMVTSDWRYAGKQPSFEPPAPPAPPDVPPEPDVPPIPADPDVPPDPLAPSSSELE